MRVKPRTPAAELLAASHDERPEVRAAVLADIQRNRVPWHAGLGARLVDLLDDTAAVRVDGRAGTVADEAVKALGVWPHTATLRAIEQRIVERSVEGSEYLWRALGAMAPESTRALLAAVDHGDERVRRRAREALLAAVRRSDTSGRAAILARAFAGLDRDAEREDWDSFLSAGGVAAFAQRAHALTAGLDRGTLTAWLDAPQTLVCGVAACGLAARARDAATRALLAARIVGALPAVSEAPPARDAVGRRRLAAPEAAAYALACWVPDALAAMRREDPRVDGALRVYITGELGRPPSADDEGGPWSVALTLARALTSDPTIVDAALARVEAGGAAVTAALLGLLAACARASSPRRAEIVRRVVLALPTEGSRADVRALADLAAIDREAFTEAVIARVARPGGGDGALAALALALCVAGAGAAPALPSLHRAAMTRQPGDPLHEAVVSVERAVVEASRRRARCVVGLRDNDPATRIRAMEELRVGAVAMDDEVVALLRGALDDPGVWTFCERDWDDIEHEFASPTRERTRRVADEARELLRERGPLR